MSDPLKELEQDLSGRSQQALVAAHYAALTAEDLKDLATEVHSEECEVLAQLAKTAVPAFFELDLCDTIDEWVPTEFFQIINNKEVFSPTSECARKYLAFQIGQPEEQKDGSFLYEIRALYLSSDGRLELLSTLGHSQGDQYQPGTYYGLEINNLPDTELAPVHILEAKNRHLLAPWNASISVLGTEFDSTRLLNELTEAFNRAALRMNDQKDELTDRAQKIRTV